MKMLELSNLTYGRWPEILLHFGAKPEDLKALNKACPWCGGTDRFTFSDKGKGSFFCRRCGAGDGWNYLERMTSKTLSEIKKDVESYLGAVPTPERKPRREDDSDERIRKFMQRIWKEAVPVTNGDPVWLYLVRRRCDPDQMRGVRLHPALEHSIDKTTHPAMVVQMVNADGSKCLGLHRTYLDPYGYKAKVDPVRMTLGKLGIVRLFAAETALGVAEGIETAACASKKFGIPVWSAISANGVEKFEPPEGTKYVTVFGDCDASYTGHAAAYNLAKRLQSMGFDVDVQIPDEFGLDWADLAT